MNKHQTEREYTLTISQSEGIEHGVATVTVRTDPEHDAVAAGVIEDALSDAETIIQRAVSDDDSTEAVVRADEQFAREVAAKYSEEDTDATRQ